ncbi:MAG: hypothetical protein AAFX99_14365 [Myxococcota bacterium]
MGSVVAVFALAAWGLVLCTDVPLGVALSDGREDRAAIAVRDRVVPFQMWGSMIFTRPLLHAVYGSTYYLAQHNRREPLEPEFVAALEKALHNHDHVDLFLISHSNRIHWWVTRIDPELRQRLRLVYNTGCYDSSQSRRWLALGADTYIGHPGLSASPVFYFYFLRRWARGQSARQSTETSNGLMKRMLFTVLPRTGGRLNPERVWRDSQATLSGEQEVSLDD